METPDQSQQDSFLTRKVVVRWFFVPLLVLATGVVQFVWRVALGERIGGNQIAYYGTFLTILAVSALAFYFYERKRGKGTLPLWLFLIAAVIIVVHTLWVLDVI